MRVPIHLIHYNKSVVAQEELDALTNSIKEKGLLHAITVVKTNKGYNLVAGEKRLLACKALKEEYIDAKIIESSSENILEVRIHENLMRSNLPWYEQVELEKQLHDLRQKQHGVPDPQVAGAGIKSGWGLRDTARELQKALGYVSQDLKLAEALANDPSLKKVKDKTTAIRLVNLASKRYEAELSASEVIPTDVDVVYCGNSMDILPRLPGGFVTACVTDPPWLHFHEKEEFESDTDTLLVFKEIYRLLKVDSFLYMFVGIDDLILYKTELPKLGFAVQNLPLIWFKNNIVSMGKRSWEYDRDYEFVLVAVKGSPALVNPGKTSSLFNYSAIPGQFLKHPNEKPLNILSEIISHCTFEGAVILDPFAGVGSTLVAAKKLERRYIGVEREHKYYKIAEGRLKQ